MKWTWFYMLIGGTFIIKLIESSRTATLINEAQQLKQVTKKPIMLISSTPRQGFDVYLNPNETNTWQLPYTNKAFASVVSDSLEEVPYPKQAMSEWMRVADTVLVNTHSIFSPEAWLDLRHHYVFMGQQTILVTPTINWAVAGGVGYFFYKRHKRMEKALPEEETEPEVAEEEEVVSPPPEEERKELPPPKVEPAPILSPEELEQLSGMEEMKTGKQINKSNLQSSIVNLQCPKPPCVNLSIGDAVTSPKVENLVFDPQHLPEEHNRQVLSQLEKKPADTATLFGVLDKITDPEERKSTLQVAYENVKMGGKVFVKVEEPKKYLMDVKQIFPSARIKQGMITGVKK